MGSWGWDLEVGIGGSLDSLFLCFMEDVDIVMSYISHTVSGFGRDGVGVR